MEVEICCVDPGSLLLAASSDVDRVELCSDISSGGVTPSAGLIELAAGMGIPSVNVLIRPRGGNFIYSEEEVRIMERDVETAGKAGATGVVIGALTPSGEVDVRVIERLCVAAEGMELVFSRAIDIASSPLEALEILMESGFDRVLTSGGAPNVTEGRGMLRKMVEKTRGRMVVMAGGGVRPENVEELYRTAGVRAFHTTAHRPTRQIPLSADPFGFGSSSCPYSDAETIARMVNLRTLRSTATR